MFCPKCGQRNEGNPKFCRGCGENLKAISKAMERRWLKLLYRALDGYIRYRHRKMSAAAIAYRKFRWLWLTCIGIYLALGVFDDNKHWWGMALLFILILLTGAWDYVTHRRHSVSGSNDNETPAQAASLSDSVAELPSAPTTTELVTFSVTEPTTRQLEPLTAVKKRSGDLL